MNLRHVLADTVFFKLYLDSHRIISLLTEPGLLKVCQFKCIVRIMCGNCCTWGLGRKDNSLGSKRNSCFYANYENSKSRFEKNCLKKNSIAKMFNVVFIYKLLIEGLVQVSRSKDHVDDNGFINASSHQ